MKHPLTADQVDIFHAIRDHNRIAVKGGHSLGKTDVLGDVVVWFLHCYDPAVVITTAPSAEQVRNEVWRYLRNRVGGATCELLPGLKPVEPFWDVSPVRYAQGYSTDKGERFRGKHSINMLIIFEEANGVPAWAWEEAENMCTASNNKILVVANPVDPSGEFYDCFKSGSGWKCITLSCLTHPNVIQKREIYPGAVTWSWVDKRVKKYATPIDVRDKQSGDFEWPAGSGQWHRPSPTFMARVMGEFPTQGPDTLIPLDWVNKARKNHLDIDPLQPIDLGVDVAYSGGDWCVIFARRGPSVICRRKWQGTDPEKAKQEIAAFIRELNQQNMPVGTVAVDAIGIGAGVAHGLIAYHQEGIIKCDRILPVQVSEKAGNNKKFANLRAELAFALAERFRLGMVDLSRLGDDANDFESQAVQINKKRETGSLRDMIESKDSIRERTKRSPDDFDAMMLAFVDTKDYFAETYAQVMSVG